MIEERLEQGLGSKSEKMEVEEDRKEEGRRIEPIIVVSEPIK